MPLQSQHAVDFIIETLRQAPPKSITLCPLGPLTNIGTALQNAPDIAENIAQIVMMGGAYFEVGNITPAAEFNIFVDPDAAQIVFNSGINLVVAPLDVTHQALTNKTLLSYYSCLTIATKRQNLNLHYLNEQTDKFVQYSRLSPT